MTRAQPGKPSDPDLSITGQACEQVAQLSTMFKSYVGLEKLVTPRYEGEAHAGGPSSRTELSAMLQSLNALVLLRLATLADTAAMLHAAEAARRGPSNGAGPGPLSPPPA